MKRHRVARLPSNTPHQPSPPSRVDVVACLVLALLVTGSRARALDPCRPRADLPAVSMELDQQGQRPAVDPFALERQLSAALAARGLQLCVASEAGQPVARLRISMLGTEGEAEANIEVVDTLTRKRVARTLSLADVPGDGRALAVALSADELLRASWAELALRDGPAPELPPPPAVLRAVEPRSPTTRRIELFLAPEASWQRTRTAFAAHVRGYHWLAPSWGVTASLGQSFGLRERSDHGSVRADALEATLGVARAFVPTRQKLGAHLEALVSLRRVAFDAQANASGEGASFHALTSTAHLRVRGHYGEGPLRLAATFGGGWVLRPVSATDDGRLVTRMRGLALDFSLSVGLFL